MMRALLILFLFVSLHFCCYAQEKAVVLSDSMFQSHQRLFLAPLDGWIFKQGNDPLWADENADLTGWKAFNPTLLNAKMADETGRVEGWFRIRIRLDDSFKGMPLGIARDLWAATDIYLDGKLVHAFGNTGNPYTAYNPILKYPVPVKLIPGREYLLAMHFVDYETTFTQREIRLQPRNLQNLIDITGPAYIGRVTQDYKLTHIYGAICISVSFLLSFLFWLLVFLNPSQRIFWLIASMTTFVLTSSVGSFYNTFFELTYPQEKLRYVLSITSQPIMTVSGLIIMEWVLIKKISWISIALLVLTTGSSTFAHLFSVSWPFGIIFNGMLVYFFYLLIKSWKTIQGAQWAVVAATVVPTLFAVMYVTLHKYSLDLFYEYDKPITSLTFLGAPLLLMVYISIRIKEILKDVSDEAQKVVEVTEEKREILSNQNIVLESQVKERTAELQQSNRELAIETSIERVRARTMSMQHSRELADASFILAQQVNNLGIKTWGCAFNIYNEHAESSTEWFSGEEGTLPTYTTPREGLFLRYYEKGQSGETLYIETFEGKACAEHYEYLCSLPDVGDGLRKLKAAGIPFPTSQIDHVAYFKYGYLLFITFEPAPEAYEIFKRFAMVFEQTYTRFLDLKKAEEQAREAQIELSLERVRAKTMAMHNSVDVGDTVVTMLDEVLKLGIETIRCGIGIMHEPGEMEVWTAKYNETGKADLVIGRLDMMMHPLLAGAFNSWRNRQEFYTYELAGDDLVAYFNAINDHADYPVRYDVATLPDKIVHSEFQFTEGTLFVFSAETLSAETSRVFKRFASVFGQTYRRYLDLQKAEALALRAAEDLVKLQTEKRRAEDALTELKATQRQLIQSEKMASLGELTAGIAHEIQNPLNFVNNFSEVSSELLAEMNEELEKGDLEEVKAIASDIKDNLEKINHHGKRADSIVKGMLQHSRSSSVTKEPTDINALAEEYIRLTFHGLRAKDQSFNATIKTHFDQNLGKIEIVPQDIGRVILNLLNNAFYAVQHKQKSFHEANYEPVVTVLTKKEGDKVIVRVQDNGGGIPEHVLAKIFQPFFTTKPTGQGTGLGLSLSYDIVTKGHGGELRVESKEGLGSVFTVVL